MIESTRAQLPKYVVKAMVVVGTIPMPSKVIGRKACLQSKGPFRLSKDVGLKRRPNTWRGWKYTMVVHFGQENLYF